jgi:hypothetical protein
MTRGASSSGGAVRRPTFRVASCPEWTGADLLAHAAGFCRTVDELVAAMREPTTPAVVVTPEGAPTRYEADLDRLLTVLADTEPDPRVPNWSAPPDEARSRVRRAAQEFTIHRWDAGTTAAGQCSRRGRVSDARPPAYRVGSGTCWRACTRAVSAGVHPGGGTTSIHASSVSGP